MQPELQALSRADLDWTQDLGGIWRDAPGHVDSLHGEIAGRVAAEFAALTPPRDAPPLGRVIQGGQGAGKTHLLGTLRRHAWAVGGWFVVIEPAGAAPFWDSAALGFVNALDRPLPSGGTQGDLLLARLLSGPARPPSWLRQVLVRHRGPRVDGLLAAVQALDRAGAARHRDVVAAVAHLRLADGEAAAYAHAWLRGLELDAEQRRATQIIQPRAAPRDTVAGLSWLLALAGPTMCAIDQIDAVIGTVGAGAGLDRRDAFHDLSHGLMDLRDVTRRTMMVVSTLESSWDLMLTRSVASFAGRFRDPLTLPYVDQPATACELVAARLAPAYRDAGFAPPYPSWPFHAAAFLGSVNRTPRDLLRRCRAHVDACLARGAAFELVSFDGTAPPAGPAATDGIAARYERLCARTHPIGLHEEATLSALVGAALRAWWQQHAPEDQDTVELRLDAEALAASVAWPGRRVSFHVSASTNARAVQSGLAAAQTASGIGSAGALVSRLVLVRSLPWPTGAKTADMVRGIKASGGIELCPDVDEARRFDALRVLFEERSPELAAWVRAVRPIDGSLFLRAALAFEAPAPVLAPPRLVAPAAPVSVPPPAPRPPTGSTAESIPLGRRESDGAAVELPLSMLARHVAVIAGSGSGKTVLLRRIAEEAVLAGIPAILIDSNNDLVRMADPWPEAPAGFGTDDAAKARRFADSADVVVWTPGQPRGNPVSLSVMPDFISVRGDAEDLDSAVEMAAANILPLIKPRVAPGDEQAGVLRDALRSLARHGEGTLPALVDLLRDLPPEASGNSRAASIAVKVADKLVAAISTNPLLQAAGPPLDPARLLTGEGGRVRVSVVNLSGLPTPEAQQDFVCRLSMALFGYVKRHPVAAGRTVGGLLVMDEAHVFAPSGRASASGPAVAGLARQARKYGLGLVFATQAPKDIDHTIINNCATKLIGRINSPAAAEAARDMLATAGGQGADIGRLKAGQFYAVLDGLRAPVRIQAPLCLTCHPASPPSEQEVVAQAARHRAPMEA